MYTNQSFKTVECVIFYDFQIVKEFGRCRFSLSQVSGAVARYFVTGGGGIIPTAEGRNLVGGLYPPPWKWKTNASHYNKNNWL